MNSTTFWDTTPCSPLQVNRCFGETRRLHLQNRLHPGRYLLESSHLLRRHVMKTYGGADVQLHLLTSVPDGSEWPDIFLGRLTPRFALDRRLGEFQGLS
jgi:hypothetical protein